MLQTLLGVLWPARMAEARKRRSSLKGVLLTAASGTVVWYLMSGRRASALVSRGPQAAQFTARVRDSVALTLAEGSAGLRFAASLSSLFGGLAWSFPGPAGRIDFTAQRCLYSNGEFWLLLGPGLRLSGMWGEWEWAPDHADALTEDDPFWLLALVAGSSEATDEGARELGGTPCRRYLTTTDFALAAARSERRLMSPWRGDIDDPQRLRLEVWLDANGRVRRARLYGKRSSTSLELFDFGGPGPIELPPSVDIQSYDGP